MINWRDDNRENGRTVYGGVGRTDGMYRETIYYRKQPYNSKGIRARSDERGREGKTGGSWPSS